MVGILFTEPVLTIIIISIFLASGIGILFLHWKKPVVMPGVKSRRWLGQTIESALFLCGIVFFLLTVLFVFDHHRNAFYGWFFVVVASTLIMTITYTFFAYKIAFGAFTAIGGKIEPMWPYLETDVNMENKKE